MNDIEVDPETLKDVAKNKLDKIADTYEVAIGQLKEIDEFVLPAFSTCGHSDATKKNFMTLYHGCYTMIYHTGLNVGSASEFLMYVHDNHEENESANEADFEFSEEFLSDEYNSLRSENHDRNDDVEGTPMNGSDPSVIQSESRPEEVLTPDDDTGPNYDMELNFE